MCNILISSLVSVKSTYMYCNLHDILTNYPTSVYSYISNTTSTRLQCLMAKLKNALSINNATTRKIQRQCLIKVGYYIQDTAQMDIIIAKIHYNIGSDKKECVLVYLCLLV